MGWQSYTVGFNSEEEKQSILDVIRKHNTNTETTACDICGDPECDQVGEELFGINVLKVKKPYKRGPLAHFNYFMMFGNGGGRSHTFTFMIKNWVRVVPMIKAHEDRCDMKTAENIALEYENEA